LVRELGLIDCVRFMGKRDDVRDILAQSDFLVHAAIAEGCAYAILESMAAGIPAIVTDSGAAREQIEDGVSGFVVDSEDEHQFELAVTLLAGDSGLRTRMGTAARERWHRRFHADQSAKAYGALFLKR
jgi:glycosyltransferase involved in cell wall biosynthesis